MSDSPTTSEYWKNELRHLSFLDLGATGPDSIGRAINIQKRALQEEAFPFLKQSRLTNTIITDNTTDSAVLMDVLSGIYSHSPSAAVLDIMHNAGKSLYIGAVDSNVITGHAQADEAVGKYFQTYGVAVAETYDEQGRPHEPAYILETAKHELFHSLSFLYYEENDMLLTERPEFVEAYQKDLEFLRSHSILPAPNGVITDSEGGTHNLSHQLSTSDGGHHTSMTIAREEAFAEIAAGNTFVGNFFHNSSNVLSAFQKGLVSELNAAKAGISPEARDQIPPGISSGIEGSGEEVKSDEPNACNTSIIYKSQNGVASEVESGCPRGR